MTKVRAYLFALAFGAAGILVRLLLDRLIHHPNLFFSSIYAAIALSVWHFGWKPGIVTAVACFLTALAIDLPHPFSGGIGWLLLAYSCTCAVIIGFGEAARRRRFEILSLQQAAAKITAARLEAAANLAHSVRNPLEAMSYAVYLLRRHPPLEQQATCLDALESGVRRITNATEQAKDVIEERGPESTELEHAQSNPVYDAVRQHLLRYAHRLHLLTR